MPKLGSAGTIHKSIIRRSRKDGSKYVQEVYSVYDVKTKNNKVIKSVTLGILPPGETDIEKVQPLPPKQRATKTKAQTIAEMGNAVTDTRRDYLVVYPLDLYLLVILMAQLAGYTSCRQIAEYCKQNYAIFKAWFDDFPDSHISHDTVRNIIKIIGKTDANKLIQRFTEPLVNKLALRTVSLDGQATRAASREDPERNTARYTLNLFDSDNELCLQQVLIEAKENEITQAVNIVKDIDLTGAVVTCDALNTQKKFARTLIEEKHCDYCFAVKKNHKGLFDQVAGWFKTRQGQQEAKTNVKIDLGHGRIEEREIRVLPANLMQQYADDILDGWTGLEDGCIVMATTRRTDVKHPDQTTDETRYFITSLHFDRDYISQTMARIIRRHWMIENGLHWVLDVTYNQDRTQCKNADFLAGKTALNKVVFNLTSKAQSVEITETGSEPASKPVMKVKFSKPEEAVKLIHKLYAQSK